VFKNTLALELAPFGVRVNLLVPGHYPTGLTAGVSEETERIMRSQIPLRRLGRTAELGPAAVLLLSDKLSPYTTGAELTVDGGLHLRPLPLWTDDELMRMNQPD
jgi:3-oxoacyl-[acyl-carrier protein] reductase